MADLIQLRKDHAAALAPSDWGTGMPLEWKGPGGGEPDWDSQSMMMHYVDDGSQDWPAELAILVNMSNDEVTFSLPSGRSWGRVVDTQAYWDDEDWFEDNPDLDTRTSANIELGDPDLVGSSYGVPAKTIVIVEDRSGS